MCWKKCMNSLFRSCMKDTDSETTPLTEKSETKEGERETWGHKSEFILATIGIAVGLGNIWRFPYLCQKNGGGAFLIPYFIMMVIEGIPLFFIEFAVGQRFKQCAIGCWRDIHPALTGVGISCLLTSMYLCIYYVAVLAWAFYYLFASFTSSLPWKKEYCFGYREYKAYSDQCALNSSAVACEMKRNFSHCCVHDPQLYYFYNKALNISPSIEDMGDGVQWKMFGCLLLTWIVVYLCIVKGIKSSGKVVYFTATFPYVILTVLFFVGVTLEGADIGLKALFEPDFERLLDSQIWLDAASQIFFSLTLGFGTLISYASYMPTKNNCIRDAYVIVFINCGTSIYGSIVLFSILGHRELKIGVSAKKIGGGPGLAFITFCDAFLQMDASSLWSVLFFIMLILLGVDSQFGVMEAFISPLYDMKWVTMNRQIFSAIAGVTMMLIGVFFVTSPGFYFFQIFDDFSLSLGLLFIAFFQTIAVSWVYGTDRFANDIEFMTGKRPALFWMFCWKYISPLAIAIIFVSNCRLFVTNGAVYKAYVGCSQQLQQFSPFGKGVEGSIKAVHYPVWTQIIITILISAPIITIVGYLLKDLIQNPYHWLQGFKRTFTNPYEYHPDPSMVDPSRRTKPADTEEYVLNKCTVAEPVHV